MVTHKEIEAFFRIYAEHTNDALKEPPIEDVNSIAASFAPFFVGSSPKCVFSGPNGDTFKQTIPKGFAHYRNIGGKAMNVTRVDLIEHDDDNIMANVSWNFEYQRKDGKEGHIAFTNRYLLNISGSAPLIFAYITPDEKRAMKDYGLN